MDGFVKLISASPKIKAADCAFNAESIKSEIEKAHKASADMLCLPELCVTGYTCGDLFLQPALLEAAEKALEKIALATKGTEMLTAVGAPVRFSGKLYNCAVVMSNGEILGAVPKTHLPNYTEFYELRHFSPAPEQECIVKICGHEAYMSTRLLFKNILDERMTAAFEICEDLWSADSPSADHAQAGAAVIGNLSASNETAAKAQYRRDLVKIQSAKLCCAYVYADAGEGESTSDLVFAGHNIISENGSVLAESELFSGESCFAEADLDRIWADRMRMNTFTQKSGYRIIEYSARSDFKPERTFPKHPFIPSGKDMREQRCREILDMQAHGLMTRLKHTGGGAVIGLSGGLDSTLAYLVTVTAFKKLRLDLKRIYAVTMPCFGTTGRTRSNAEKLAAALGTSFEEIGISDAVKQHFKDIGQDETIYDVTYENSQARERTQVLMDIANKRSSIVIGTGDLSELALGFATYNGDHMSMYGVNSSVPKTLVRHLVRYYAETCGVKEASQALFDILDTPVSPELLPALDGEISQKTESIVGPYELHDFFLYYMMRFSYSPQKIYRAACRSFKDDYPPAEILKWLKLFFRRFFTQQFKRSCLPDGVKVGSVALSPRGDWRMPSDASFEIWKQQLNQLEAE